MDSIDEDDYELEDGFADSGEAPPLQEQVLQTRRGKDSGESHVKFKHLILADCVSPGTISGDVIIEGVASQIIKIRTNGVHMAPYGPVFGQDEAHPLQEAF